MPWKWQYIAPLQQNINGKYLPVEVLHKLCLPGKPYSPKSTNEASRVAIKARWSSPLLPPHVCALLPCDFESKLRGEGACFCLVRLLWSTWPSTYFGHKAFLGWRGGDILNPRCRNVMHPPLFDTPPHPKKGIFRGVGVGVYRIWPSNCNLSCQRLVPGAFLWPLCLAGEHCGYFGSHSGSRLQLKGATAARGREACSPWWAPCGPSNRDPRYYSCDTPLERDTLHRTAWAVIPPCHPPMASWLSSLHECFWP